MLNCRDIYKHNLCLVELKAESQQLLLLCYYVINYVNYFKSARLQSVCYAYKNV